MRRWVVVRHEDWIRYRVVEAGDETRDVQPPIQQLVYRECIRSRVVAQALNYAYELGRSDLGSELSDVMSSVWLEPL